ncbi:MAG TPA: hypothetical protein VNY52_03590 [Solirubrobacteraceae bacterium]|jgi:hypothetical protein|nr:hypothetical protein [Solirubrobacteraceae bacterium]
MSARSSISMILASLSARRPGASPSRLFSPGSPTNGHLNARSLVAALALSVAGLLALSSGVAQAEPPKLISYGNFGSGSSAFAIGAAVDQSNGDVYVTGLLNTSNGNYESAHINKFDPSGKLLSPPSPFGNAYYSGAAVNPTNGHVYVLGEAEIFGPASVYTYNPNTGELLSSFSVPVSRNLSGVLTVVQIATDSAGDVYVPVVPDNEVLEYSPSGTLLNTFTGSGAQALSGPTGVAVDASGNVWVADAHNNRIEELSPTGAFIGEIESKGVEAVALDTNGDVFAMVDNSADFCGSLTPPCHHLVEYNSAGTQLADIGAGSIGVVEGGAKLPSMLAVKESSGRVYVTDGGKNLVWVYGPPTAPALGRELAAEVGTSEAKLGALVNPGGIETSYRFEYGETKEYGQTTPFPEGNVGQGVTSRTVWASAGGLAPGTTYHYRVVATNELGTVVGPDQTFTTETSVQASCPNEQLRGGFSAILSDCRAYELVTPPTKASTQPDPSRLGHSQNQAAGDGNRMAYVSLDVLPGAQTGGESYVATRGVSGWSSEDVIPLQSYTSTLCAEAAGGRGNDMVAYSADLSQGIFHDGIEERRRAHEFQAPGGCGAEAVEVVSGEPQDYENLLLRDNTTGAYELINVPPPGVAPADAHFQGASSDLGHVVFSEHSQLTANAPAGVEDLYEWTGGALRLVTVLPNGTPVVGSLAGGANAVSADGSHILFSAGGNLYVRVNGEHTVQLDESQAGGSGGGGQFVDASADGLRVFFTDEAAAGLTSDTVSGSGKNLYEYDLGTGRLTDLTSASEVGFRSVSGISADGSYVYFVAEGVLTGSQANEYGETAQGGQRNIYLSHGGATTFIAIRSNEDTGGARVSANGAFLAFVSKRSLTGYDNAVSNGTPCQGLPGEEPLRCPEIFLYSAASNQFACASCNPSGEAPTGGATMEQGSSSGGTPRYLSDSGRLFFDTTDALVPSDTNNQIDVYEYERGQVHLISAGTSSSESVFLDASESGDDAFFLTRQQLVPQDTEEEARNIYDARVAGGFPASSTPPPCTTADACRAAPVPQPAIFGAPSSATFSGAGNLASPAGAKPTVKSKSKPAQCRRGYVKKRGKCVRKPHGKAGKFAHANKKTGK